MSNISIKTLTPEEVKTLAQDLKVTSRMDAEMRKKFEKQGWKFDDYAIEKVYKGYPLVIEFCMGDFCTYPCSKRGHWLLEAKYRAPTFMDALLHVIELEIQIDDGKHWVGEND